MDNYTTISEIVISVFDDQQPDNYCHRNRTDFYCHMIDKKKLSNTPLMLDERKNSLLTSLAIRINTVLHLKVILY